MDLLVLDGIEIDESVAEIDGAQIVAEHDMQNLPHALVPILGSALRDNLDMVGLTMNLFFHAIEI